MNQLSCPREAEISQAVRTGRWQEELETHAAACPICGEVLLVARSMTAPARESQDLGPLPDSYLVWLKARLTDSHGEEEHASEISISGEALAQGVVIATLWGWLAWQWPMFHQQLAAWAPSAWYIDWASSWSFIASALSFPNTFVFWATAGMICLILLLAVEPLFTEN